MEQIDNLATLVDQTNLKVGNRVRNSSGNKAVTAITQLNIDANSDLATYVPVTVSQPTITGELFNMTGTGTANVMTQTLVGGADATTFTTTGYMRVQITDAGGRLTNGYHYIRVGTLT